MQAAVRTLFTHGEAKTVAVARYLARVAHRLVHGKAKLRMAILRAAEESDLFIRDRVERAMKVRGCVGRTRSTGPGWLVGRLISGKCVGAGVVADQWLWGGGVALAGRGLLGGWRCRFCPPDLVL